MVNIGSNEKQWLFCFSLSYVEMLAECEKSCLALGHDLGYGAIETRHITHHRRTPVTLRHIEYRAQVVSGICFGVTDSLCLVSPRCAEILSCNSFLL